MRPASWSQPPQDKWANRGLPKTKRQRQEGPESSQPRWFDLMLPLP